MIYKKISRCAKFGIARMKRSKFYTVYPIITGVYKKHKIDLIKSNVDICLGGFGGSANGFTEKVIRRYDQDLRIAHHCHITGLISMSIYHGIKTLVNIRRPEEAISSVHVRYGGDLEKRIIEYTDMYSFCYKNRGNIEFLHFEAIIDNPRKIIETSHDIERKSINQNTINNCLEFAKKQLTKKARPSKKRKQKKKEIRNRIMEHSLYKSAKNIYNKVLTYES